MKKFGLVIVVCLTLGLFVTVSGVQATDCETSSLNEPGSVLVFPLIDNQTFQTIVEIANLGPQEITLGYFYIFHNDCRGLPPGNARDDCEHDFTKIDGTITLTPNEILEWDTAIGGVIGTDRVFVPPLQLTKGFLVVWAQDPGLTSGEVSYDYLIGDALLLTGGGGWKYNAVPHQAIATNGDRILSFDGSEYTCAPYRIWTTGYTNGAGFRNAPVPPGIPFQGTLAMCSLNIHFLTSQQPRFDLNVIVCNEDEECFSRHHDFYQFEQYSLQELLITRPFTNSDKFYMRVEASSVDPIMPPPAWGWQPVWAVFYQNIGTYFWGTNVWQDPETGEDVEMSLPFQ
jgi:hypothetical protein